MKMIDNYTATDARTIAIKSFEDRVHEYLNNNGITKSTKLCADLSHYWVYIPDFDFVEYLENMVDRSVIQELNYEDDSNKERTAYFPNSFTDFKISGYRVQKDFRHGGY